MEIDRRSLLRAAAGTAVAGLVPIRFAGAAAASGTAAATDMASFSKYLNSAFKFHVGGRTLTMRLRAVIDDRTTAAKAVPGAGESFSLMFPGTVPAFSQGTYNVDHPAFGRLRLFVVPVGRTTTSQSYQVAFNRCTV